MTLGTFVDAGQYRGTSGEVGGSREKYGEYVFPKEGM
jgi:hypothetical protein